MMKFSGFLFLFLIILSPLRLKAGEVDFRGQDILIGKFLEIAEDTKNEYKFPNFPASANFVKSTSETPNLGLSKSTYWIRFTVKNDSEERKMFLELAYPMLHSCELFALDSGRIEEKSVLENSSFSQREVNHQSIVFKINVKQGTSKTFYLKIKGGRQVVLPLILRTENGFFQSALLSEIITGIFIGIILVMILYNLFIFFSTRDKSYLYYVLYILFIGLAQTTLNGYTFKYLWPSVQSLNNSAIVWFSALAGTFAILFIREFLHMAGRMPIWNNLLYGIIALYTLAVFFSITGDGMLSYRFVDLGGLIGAILTFVVALKLSLQGYRPAKFFLLAWSIFLLGLVLFVMRNLNLLPYNLFTNYTMQFGTAIEVILLSFALADKINILKKERELSQEQALRISLENEKIIREQNVSLEKKVSERTIELTQTNSDLEDTLNKLKDAQSQLIESEKMASLGQLTAGIAHEINNPINFVSSNIMPLRRDIDDVMEILTEYNDVQQIDSLEGIHTKLNQIEKLKEELDLDYVKTEIGLLLSGMEDGARRTVEIVKGLKVFSRLDESDLNFVNLNEGIESTLVILNYQMGTNLELHKNLGSIPNVECYGGKMNQVFMNILTNSIYAVQKSNLTDRKPTIWVKTFLKDNEHVTISIKDNGSGMSPEVKAKIYDPFFTTKDVGEGTGLGLSIVFKIIEVHYGTIEVISEVNQGTEFIITLPITKKNSLT
ncbi:7TM diverse intracellular signaling domain-containing protein [Dyadobacter sp. CY356]|uniref:sensor histidine kinase n=1 Tax=Dyadobacter sp. CY356 TaxID=2906442 RepID=UPI001F417228|nr:7TM diverse intracellular signaling domain-containing protein [Dyadobacter sp. CY356]MCF0057225.1 ATP-binding protein [Dyadobacter sp. CY356]